MYRCQCFCRKGLLKGGGRCADWPCHATRAAGSGRLQPVPLAFIGGNLSHHSTTTHGLAMLDHDPKPLKLPLAALSLALLIISVKEVKAVRDRYSTTLSVTISSSTIQGPLNELHR